MNIFFNIFLYFIIFGLPIILPIGIIWVLFKITKSKNLIDNSNEEPIEDAYEEENYEEEYVYHKSIKVCAYCDSEESCEKGTCRNCGAHEFVVIRKPIYL